MELCLSSFSGALSDCCRFSATFSVKEFYGYGTLSSFSEAGTTGIYNTDFENKNYVWENGVFCLSFVLVNSWKADSYRVIKLIQAETIFKSACNLWRSLLGNKKLYFAWKEKTCLSELVLNTVDSRTLFCSFFSEICPQQRQFIFTSFLKILGGIFSFGFRNRSCEGGPP